MRARAAPTLILTDAKPGESLFEALFVGDGTSADAAGMHEKRPGATADPTGEARINSNSAPSSSSAAAAAEWATGGEAGPSRPRAAHVLTLRRTEFDEQGCKQKLHSLRVQGTRDVGTHE